MDIRLSTILVTPAMRGIVAGSLTSLALWQLKPAAFFRRDGEPRIATWAVARPDQLSASTNVPWYLVTAAVALAVALYT